jgi:hypothetical protein
MLQGAVASLMVAAITGAFGYAGLPVVFLLLGAVLIAAFILTAKLGA